MNCLKKIINVIAVLSMIAGLMPSVFAQQSTSIVIKTCAVVGSNVKISGYVNGGTGELPLGLIIVHPDANLSSLNPSDVVYVGQCITGQSDSNTNAPFSFEAYGLGGSLPNSDYLAIVSGEGLSQAMAYVMVSSSGQSISSKSVVINQCTVQQGSLNVSGVVGDGYDGMPLGLAIIRPGADLTNISTNDVVYADQCQASRNDSDGNTKFQFTQRIVTDNFIDEGNYTVIVSSDGYSKAKYNLYYGNANIYYVATDGNDSNAGTIDLPFKTIQKAAAVMVAGDSCYIRGGTYREPTIKPANSGVSGSKITFLNYPGETVNVSGADVISGWTQYSGNIYVANAALGLGDGNQLFVGGSMYNEARWPNNTGVSLLQPTLATADSANATSITDADLTQPDGFWNGATVWCVSGYGYIGERRTISTYTQSSHSFSFPSYHYTTGAGDKYYITGTLNALDTEKEWYYDSSSHKVYLYKEGGGDPSAADVEVKSRNYGFDLSDRSYIDITGINLFATGLKTDSHSSNCTFNNLTAQYIMNGTSGEGGINLSGSNLELKNSTVQYSSGSLVIISGTSNKLDNCLIQMGNYEATWDPIVNISGSSNLISNNTICEAGRACIGVSGVNNQIQYNDIYNAGRLTKDLGIIYQANADGGNTRIHHNKIHDNVSTGMADGIYLDNFTENYIIDHNVVWNCQTALRLNTPSNNILVYNNTLVGSGASINHWGSSYANDMYGNKIFNNICTNTIIPAGGATVGNNILSTTIPLFVNAASFNFHIQSTSPAIDTGTVLSGITDGYAGTKPDIGAYEYSGADWTAGYNFSSPPSPTFSSTNAPYMNLVQNAGFETGTLSSWNKTGAQNASVINDNAWSNTNAAARSNYYGLRLGGTVVTDGVTQTITGLSPNTTYVISAWLKTSNSAEAIQIGAKNYGTNQGYASTTNTAWTQILYEFTTGAANTTADIYLLKSSSGTNYVYADCISVIPKDSNTNVESFENGFSNWSASSTPAVSSVAHDGSCSYSFGDNSNISKTLNANYYTSCSIWFYDDSSDSSLKCIARVDDGATCRGIGVNTDTSRTYYSVLAGTTWSRTTKVRSTGWHEFKWQYITGAGVNMYIDGTQVHTSTNVKTFNYIALGDFWADGKIGNVYFDDIKIKDVDSQQVTVNVPYALFTDADGNIIDDITGATSINARVHLTPDAFQNGQAVGVVALYSQGGVLIKATVKTVSQGVYDVQASLTGVAVTKGNYAKIFIWKGLGNISPALNSPPIIRANQ